MRSPLPLLAAALALSGCVGKTTVGNTDTVEGTVQICASGHGPRGLSTDPAIPHLAGQQHDYLVAQLVALRGHTRADHHARTNMLGMAQNLSDPTIEGVARYFAALPPPAAEPAEPEHVAAGRKLFTTGAPDRDVPPCGSCHGAAAEGNGVFPRLAGQHQVYLAGQLGEFRTNGRANETMHANAANLEDEEIRNLAAYLASL